MNCIKHMRSFEQGGCPECKTEYEAAPAMLAALKTVERVLRGEMTSDILVADGTDRTLGEVIRDAIARATELERSAGCSDNATSKWK